MTLVIAHRGASLDAPENTLEAFDLAVEQGADMIETDLHLSKDGAVPLLHDSELDGAPVGSFTLAALREKIPDLTTLEETLDRLGDRVAFNLELKSLPKYEYEGIEKRVLDEVRRRGLLERTLFSCFYDPVLERVRALDPAARFGLLVSRRSQLAIAERAARLGAEAVHSERAITTRELVHDLHGAGYHVRVYTVDDRADQRRLLQWGVDGIFTNAPARLRGLLSGEERGD